MEGGERKGESELVRNRRRRERRVEEVVVAMVGW